MTDQELIRRFVQRRDQDAFAELVKRHLDMVYGIARRSLPAEAEDIAQATFILLSRRAASLQGRASIAGWLFRVANYCCRNAVKRQRRRAHHEIYAGKIMVADATDNREMLTGALDEALAKLPLIYREAVLLRYLEGRSPEETAAALGVSRVAAVKRARRGIAQLRRHFSRAGYSVGIAAITAALLAESAKAAPVHVATAMAASASGGMATGKAIVLADAAGKALTGIYMKIVGGIVAAMVVAVGTVTVERMMAAANAPAASGAPITPIAASMASATSPGLDEKTVAGDMWATTFDLMLDEQGADAVRKATQAEPSKGDYFEMRRANAGALREVLRAMLREKKIVATSYYRPTAAVVHGTRAFWDTGAQNITFSSVTRPGGRFNSTINFPDEWAKLEVLGESAEWKVDFDNYASYLDMNGRGQPGAVNVPAGVHWSGKVEPGEMIVMLHDWGQWQGDHLATARVIEVYKMTGAQSDCTRELSVKPWIDAGPARVRGLADSARVWTASGAKEWSKGQEKWTRKLSDGTVVRLMGIAKPAQYPFCWWNADGVATPQSYGLRNVWQMQTAYGAAVQVMRPGKTFSLDFLGYMHGTGVVMPEGEKQLRIFVGMGEWKEQEIMPREEVTLGDGYVQMTRARAQGDTEVEVELRGMLGPETQVDVEAVTKTGNRVGHVWLTSDDIVAVTSATLGWKPQFFTIPVAAKDVDHYVLRSRTREAASFENFAGSPVSAPRMGVTAEEARAADEIVAWMNAVGSEQHWKDVWGIEEADRAKLETIARDETTPAGAMRLLVDKARQGDAQGVEKYLDGKDEQLVKEVAQGLAAFGHVYDLGEKKFGAEPLARAFSRSRFITSLESALLKENWVVVGDHATNGLWEGVGLINRDGRWRIAIDESDAPPGGRPGYFNKENFQLSAKRFVEVSRQILGDMESGKIRDASWFVDEMRPMMSDAPPLPPRQVQD